LFPVKGKQKLPFVNIDEVGKDPNLCPFLPEAVVSL
jgi:hypothetical protein